MAICSPDAHPTNELALFSGAGGLSLGLRLAVPSLRTVCHVEREAYAAAVLVARMEEQAMDPAPIWDDVTTFDGRPWRGVVDCIAGGFPCQDISNAGKRAGIGGERSGLWKEYARILDEVRPRFVFVENVAALVKRGLDVVLSDLAALGFDAEWGVFRASEAGAPHRRERIFILAHSERVGGVQEWPPWERASVGELAFGSCKALAHADERGREVVRSGGLFDGGRPPPRNDTHGCGGQELGDAHLAGLEGRGLLLGERRGERPLGAPGTPRAWPPGPDDAAGWRSVLEVRPDLEPAVRRVAHGLAYRVDRLRLCGNGVVPQQAALAYRTLHARLFG
jgi:DNA (cytosine-5)-methyltransferase 1